jgi:hypothetical protein
MRNTIINAITRGEEGHGLPLIGALIGAAGAVLLGIGAAGDTDWMSIAGGIGIALGFFVLPVLNHMNVEYELYGRIEKLEGKQ